MYVDGDQDSYSSDNIQTMISNVSAIHGGQDIKLQSQVFLFSFFLLLILENQKDLSAFSPRFCDFLL